MKRLLIANRGEIACRIIETARRMGIETVAIYSDADADARHVRMADFAVAIGPAPAAESYLSIERVLDAAKRSGSDAVHPGYGFLSENPDFAEACVATGLIFVGPPPQAMRAMASKRLAKEKVAKHGVPVLPGYHGGEQDEAALVREAERIGLPLMIKASAGGGGKGLRLVTDPAELAPQIARARAEALAAFGDGELILERALIDPRHVEIQVFADAHGNLVHLGERDCSVQRRHQKVTEEAPSPAVTRGLRAAMGEAAVKAAASVSYVGAGTVEFLLDSDGAFWFMEMNTRLQVEHPVTEMVTGLDLVEWQLHVARGEKLPLQQDEIAFKGHAIEARLYAEDAYAGFLPQTGKVLRWSPAAGEGVRIDHGVTEGGEVTAFYDPMLAKLIAHGANREEARRRLIRALDETVMHGVTTNRGFLRDILEEPAFAAGEATTGLIGAIEIAAPEPPSEAKAVAAAILAAPGGSLGWRSHGTPAVVLSLDGEIARVTPGLTVEIAGAVHRVSFAGEEVEVAGVRRRVPVTRDGDTLFLDWDGATFAFTERPLGKAAGREEAAADSVTAPMPGMIVEVAVAPGDRVGKGGKLVVMEAMKMQMELRAEAAGTVAEVNARKGDQVAARTLLVRLDLEAAE